MMNVPIRLYDKNAKAMLYPEQGTKNGVFLSMHGEPIQMQNGVFARLMNVIVLHRTPHIDATGKHIWEADVCDFDIPNEFGSLMHARGFMCWDMTMMKWNLQITAPKNNMLAGAFEGAIVGAHVIGDIYTAPDLIKHDPNETYQKQG